VIAEAEPPVIGVTVQSAEADPLAATPTLRLKLAIDTGDRAVRGLALNARLRIRAERRRYEAAEAERLRELFGAPDDHARSLGPLPWTEATLIVGPFTGVTVTDMRVPCTYDFEVAAAKYLAALAEGHVPLELLFSGTVHWTAADGRLQTAMVPWDCETTFRLPLETWRRAVRASFGDSAWLRLHRDVFARLQAFRARRGLTSWEEAVELLLDVEAER
jgi:hypothetical protein